MVCGAKKKDGTPCQRRPMPNGKCYLHGGKSPAGLASGTFRTGRYSKALPARLLARYEQAQTDPDLLALREEVVLLDARLADVLSRVDTGESGALWKQARQAMHAFLRARVAGKKKEMHEALTALEDVITRGAADYAAWDEIASVIEQRRKLVESERKRLIEMQQTITAEKAMTLVQALLESVRQNVTDRQQLAAIQSDFVRLMTFDTTATHS